MGTPEIGVLAQNHVRITRTAGLMYGYTTLQRACKVKKVKMSAFSFRQIDSLVVFSD
jgi:hypothetical protein